LIQDKCKTEKARAWKQNEDCRVLIDSDNIPSAYVKALMEEIVANCNPTIKHIYDEWIIPRALRSSIERSVKAQRYVSS